MPAILSDVGRTKLSWTLSQSARAQCCVCTCSLLQGYGFGNLEWMATHVLSFAGAFLCPLMIYAWQSELAFTGGTVQLPYYWVCLG